MSVSAQRREIKENRAIEIEKEIKKLLLEEKKIKKMDANQTEKYEKYKKLLEDKGCEIISTVYKDAKTKIVFKCKGNDEHKLQAAEVRTLQDRAGKQSTCCAWCKHLLSI